MDSRPNIAYLVNANPKSGVGHRAYQIRRRLEEEGSSMRLTRFALEGERALLSKNGRPAAWLTSWPGILGSKSVNWIRLGSLLKKYVQSTDKNSYQLFHATNQTLSFLRPSFSPFVVTVHDIIEVTDSQTTLGGILSRYLYKGISEADHIIAVSDYTANQVQEYYGVPPEKITVIYNGASGAYHLIEGFKQSDEARELSSELDIPAGSKVVLYVGSDHPRKNLKTALRAFAKVAESDSRLLFVKVGDPGISSGREATVEEARNLSITDKMRFTGAVPIATLNHLYNVADVLLFPSYHEGFGLPPLQAMACGLPVISSNATSLPEVMGDAGIMHDPDDVDSFATSLALILGDDGEANRLRQAGLVRAKEFSWDVAADQVKEVYKELL